MKNQNPRSRKPKDYRASGTLIALSRHSQFVNSFLKSAGEATWMESLFTNYKIETLVDVNGEEIAEDFAD